MRVTVLYFDGCPNWQVAEARVREALARLDRPEDIVTCQRVTSDTQAQALGFRGSPTILVDGRDPFADPSAPVGLTCRVYRSAEGLSGAPTIDHLLESMR